MSCEQCFRESRINPRITHFPLQNPNAYNTVPGDAMQIDLAPRLPPSGDFEILVTTMDVFYRYLLSYAMSN